MGRRIGTSQRMGRGLKAEERVRGIGARQKEAKGMGVKLTERGGRQYG